MYATLTQSLRALEVVRDGDVRRAAPLTLREAHARAAIMTHAIGVTLQLAAAVKAAAAGDPAPAQLSGWVALAGARGRRGRAHHLHRHGRARPPSSWFPSWGMVP